MLFFLLIMRSLERLNIMRNLLYMKRLFIFSVLMIFMVFYFILLVCCLWVIRRRRRWLRYVLMNIIIRSCLLGCILFFVRVEVCLRYLRFLFSGLMRFRRCWISWFRIFIWSWMFGKFEWCWVGWGGLIMVFEVYCLCWVEMEDWFGFWGGCYDVLLMGYM